MEEATFHVNRRRRCLFLIPVYQVFPSRPRDRGNGKTRSVPWERRSRRGRPQTFGRNLVQEDATGLPFWIEVRSIDPSNYRRASGRGEKKKKKKEEEEEKRRGEKLGNSCFFDRTTRTGSVVRKNRVSVEHRGGDDLD